MTTIAELKRRLGVLERTAGTGPPAADLDAKLDAAGERIRVAGDELAALHGFDDFRGLLQRREPVVGGPNTINEVAHLAEAVTRFDEFRASLEKASTAQRAYVASYVGGMEASDWNL